MPKFISLTQLIGNPGSKKIIQCPIMVNATAIVCYAPADYHVVNGKTVYVNQTEVTLTTGTVLYVMETYDVIQGLLK